MATELNGFYGFFNAKRLHREKLHETEEYFCVGPSLEERFNSVTLFGTIKKKSRISNLGGDAKRSTFRKVRSTMNL